MAETVVMCAPVNPGTTGLPGAVVHDCADCRVPCVCRDSAPEWARKLCVRCVANLLGRAPDTEVLTPSGAMSIFAVKCD